MERLTQFSFTGSGGERYDDDNARNTVIELGAFGLTAIQGVGATSARIEMGREGDLNKAMLIVEATAAAGMTMSFPNERGYNFNAVMELSPSVLMLEPSSCFCTVYHVAGTVQRGMPDALTGHAAVQDARLYCAMSFEPKDIVRFACACALATPTWYLDEQIMPVFVLPNKEAGYSLSARGANTGVRLYFYPSPSAERPADTGVVFYTRWGWGASTPPRALTEAECARLINPGASIEESTGRVAWRENYGVTTVTVCFNTEAGAASIVDLYRLPGQMAFLNVPALSVGVLRPSVSVALALGVQTVANAGYLVLVSQAEARFAPDSLSWACEDSTGAPGVCAASGTCHNGFGDFVCVSGSLPVAGACGDIATPADPGADTSGCADIKFSSFTAAVEGADAASAVCKVVYGVAAGSALAARAPDILFTLAFSGAVLKWDPVACADCAYNATTYELSVTVRAVAQDGTLTVPCPSRASTVAGEFTVVANAVIAGLPTALVSDQPGGVAVPYPALRVTTAVPHCDASLTFSPSAPSAVTGTLYAHVGCRNNQPIALAADRTVIQSVDIALPPGWTLAGATCEFYVALYYYPIEHLYRASTKLTATPNLANGQYTISVSSPALAYLNEVGSFMLLCNGVTGSTADGAASYFGVTNTARAAYTFTVDPSSLTAGAAAGVFNSSPTYVAFEVASAGSTQLSQNTVNGEIRSSIYLTSVFPIASGVYSGTTASGYIFYSLTDQYRSLVPVLTHNTTLSGFKRMFSYFTVSAVTGGAQGAWKCDNDGTGVYTECRTIGGVTCGTITNNPVCVDAANAIVGELACLAKTKPPTSTTVTSGCTPRVSPVSFAADSTWVNFTFSLVDARQFVAAPEVAVYVYPPRNDGAAAWSQCSTSLSAVRCNYATLGGIVVYVSAVTTATGNFTVNIGLTWDNYIGYGDSLTLSVAINSVNALAPGSQTVFPIEPRNTVDMRPTVRSALFTPTTANGRTGTLVLSTRAVSDTLSATSFYFDEVSLKLPRDWSIEGATCYIYYASWVAGWSPVRITRRMNTLFTVTYHNLASSSVFTVLCDDVTAGAMPVTDFPVAVGFVAANSTKMVVDASSPAGLTYDPTNAPLSRRYVSILISTSLPVSYIVRSDVVSLYNSRYDNFGFYSFKTAGTNEHRVTIELSGRDRAFEAALASATAALSMVKEIERNFDGVFSVPDTAPATGDAGDYQCRASASDAFTSCVMTPPGCSDVFQGAVTCVIAGAEIPGACYGSRPPEAATETAACVPAFATLTLKYAAATEQITVSFTKKQASFLGRPTLTLTLTPSVAGLFDWDGAAAACTGGAVCSVLPDGSLTVTLASVDGADAADSFTVASPAAKYGAANETVTVTAVTDAGVNVLSDVADTVFALNAEAGVIPILAAEAEFSVVFAPYDSTKEAGSVLISGYSLGAASATPLFTGRLAAADAAGLSVMFPADWDVLPQCFLAVRTSSGASVWPFALSFTASTGAYNAVVGEHVIALPAGVAGDSIYGFQVQCNATAPPRITSEPVALAVLGVGQAFVARAEVAPTLTYDPSTAHLVPHVIFTEATLTDTVLAVDAAALAAAAVATAPATDVAALAAHDADSGDVSLTLRLALGSRVFADALRRPDALASLLLSAVPGAAVADFTFAEPAQEALAGAWQCNIGGVWGDCAAPNDCGHFAGELGCYEASTAAAQAPFACAFDASELVTPVTAGCGAWQCKTVAGALVACTDASVCAAGCAQDVPIAVDTAPGVEQHRDATFLGGAYEQFCVLGGAIQTDDAVETFCPAGVVAPASYAATCNTTATCALQCAGVDGTAKSCDSDLSWGACSASCGAGTQNRLTYCAGSALAIGTTLAGSAAVDAGFCAGAVAVAPVSRACFGASCDYAWKCLDYTGAAVDCTDAVYAPCSASCGAGTQTRTVVCATVDGATVTSAAAPEAMCAARVAKPASSKACTTTACANAAWKCYAVGDSPFAATDCASDVTFKCAASGCRAATSARRNVACYDGAVRAAADKCSEPAPAAVTNCAAVHDGCHVDFTGAACTIQGTGAVAGNCVAAVGDDSNMFRRGVCRDDKGAAVAGACTTAETDEMCVFPMCAASVTYAWSTDSTAACVPGCRSYKPVTPLCMASTGTGAAVSVDVSFCALAPNKPLPYAPCPDTACLNGGVCAATAPVVFGSEAVPGLLAQCACSTGFSGALCGTASAVGSVSVDASIGRVRWAIAAGNSPYVTISTAIAAPAAPAASSVNAVAWAVAPLSAAQGGAWTLVAIVPADSNYDAGSGTSSFVMDLSGYAANTYIVRVAVAGGANSSVTFTYAPACAACENGGSCDVTTGACACVGDYSGPRCEVAPCATRACNPLTSSCDLTSASTAQCVCQPGFAGPRCGALIGACPRDATEGVCANGAVRMVLTADGAAACGACQCGGSWSGALCNTCALQCQNGGAPAPGACNVCSCRAGFHGVSCELRHTTLTLNFLPTAAEVGTEGALAAWTRRLELSLSALIGDASVPVSVTATQTVTDPLTGAVYLQTTIAAGSYAPGSAEMLDAYARLAALKEHLGGSAATGTTAEAGSLEAFTELALVHGVGFSDEHCADDAETACPTGSLRSAAMPPGGEEIPRGDGGLSTGAKIAIGVCLGIGGAILIASLLYCLLRPKASASVKPTNVPADAEVEMTEATPDGV